MNFAISPCLLKWLAAQKANKIHMTSPSFRTARKQALKAIRELTDNYEGLTPFKWGTKDHKFWNHWQLYRGEDSLQIDSEEEWLMFKKAVGKNAPEFWTPDCEIANNVYRRQGTLLHCQLKSGSVAWWVDKHDRYVALTLLVVLQEFLMNVTRGIVPHQKARRHINRLRQAAAAANSKSKRKDIADPIAYWCTRGALRKRTGWPNDLIATTLHTMRQLFGDSKDLPQVLHTGCWYGSGGHTTEIIVVDPNSYKWLDYLAKCPPNVTE